MSRACLSSPRAGAPRVAGGLLLSAAVLALAGPARAQRVPLSQAEQDRVNRAIEAGARFLRASQQQTGGWSKADEQHRVGYAALPALTLLECGAGPRDPAVVAAANVVRARADKLDLTYDVSLSILFLDRLGEPSDKRIIHMLALRLVAGQSPTGGWGYRVPVLNAKTHYDLLTALRQSEPDNALALLPPVPRDPGLAQPGDPKNDLALPGDRKDDGNPYRDDKKDGALATVGPDGSPVEVAIRRGPSPRTGGCIKALDPPPTGSPDGERKEARPPAEKKPFVPPDNLRGLPVFTDPKNLAPRDLPDRPTQPLLPTTDNSNTQFAILALWAARRHDVPLKRTLALIARRYHNSQAADGSWTYHYVPGGGADDRPAMNAVGLIGLAVGHGLTADGKDDRPPVRDPRVVRGFAALGRHIGKPAFRMEGLQQPNLYFLWSVERAAVLYGLPLIGDKDWYRWGAECLIANQTFNGSWDKGGYWAANPVVDTCLALLFLKRANLATDLTETLPINPDELARAIDQKPKTAPPDDKKDAPPPEQKPPTGAPEQPLIPAKPDLDDKADPQKGDPGRTSAGPGKPAETPRSEADRADKPRERPLWPLILGGAAVVLLLGGLAVWQPWKKGADGGGDDDADDDEEEERRPRRRKARRGRARDDDD
jgi:hypothetical protein